MSMDGYQRSAAGEANGQVDSSGTLSKGVAIWVAQRDSLRWGEALWPEGGTHPSSASLQPQPGEKASPWPEGHPLPLPQWGPPKDAVVFASVEEYEDLAAYVEHTVQQQLQAHHYNTTGNLIRFYDEWKKSGENNVKNFYRKYDAPITAEHFTCVGLGLDLMKRLEVLSARYPNIAAKPYLVSCEEAIDQMQGYIIADPCVGTCEKEHVLVAMKIIIQGRRGLLLLDPGYHVARAVTVMLDGCYPHTGIFKQSEEPGKLIKEYSYTLTNNMDYVVWKEREIRDGVETTTESAVYVARPYLTPVNVTERRNLVYNFRSWLARDTKGHLLAGLYFPVKETTNITMFYEDSSGDKKRIRIDPCMPDVSSAILTIVSTHLKVPVECLQTVIKRIGTIMHDRVFLRQILELNRDIGSISMEN